MLGVYEAPNTFAGSFIGIRGLDAERVHATVHVGVDGGVEVDQRVDDLPRLLRARGVVEIDQRPTVDETLEDGKVRAHALDINRCGLVYLEHQEIIPN